jgi:hypothetical protein
MKLLCSNLLGLALVEEQMEADTRKIELVVAGASPGTHMLVLLEHLRQWREKRDVRITLYDPQPLDEELQKKVDADDMIKFEPRVFTDQDAQDWSNNARCVVFFSDIRSQIHGKNEHMSADEDKIKADMLAQQSWVEMMQPDYCMLKFHAPHATTDRESVARSLLYLYGKLYEQAYVKLFSAEYRLFCTKADLRRKHEYSTAAIEGHAFFHTHTTRPTTFTVQGRQMRYDDAFAAHVALKAARWLRIDAQQLLRDAKAKLHVRPMQFHWHAAQDCDVGALLLRMQQIL